MKLAELCTAYPETAGDIDVPRPADAIPKAVRLKLRSQRGHLQASLDTHVQRSPNRLGLGLRPYQSGDSLRALALRPLVLQEQLLTRTDVSPGRFHISILLHSYANMNFRSATGLPNKNQLAWATAGLLQSFHEQNAQKVDVIPITTRDLAAQMMTHAARIKRSTFCYVITDMLFDPSDRSSAARELSAAIKQLQLHRGMVVVVRDPLESPDDVDVLDNKVLALDAPEDTGMSGRSNTPSDKQSGPGYIDNLREQINELQSRMTACGWSSILTTANEELDTLIKNLSMRLTGLRIAL